VSVLTKIFVGLLVVLSLILSAATVTFVNVIDDYKRNADFNLNKVRVEEATTAASLATAESEKTALTAQLQAVTDEAGKLRGRVDTLLKDIAMRDADLAKTTDQSTRAGVDNSRLVAALAASEAMKSQFSQQLSELRAELDKVQTQLGDTNVALTDTTNKLDVTEAQRRVVAEQAIELKKRVDTLSNELKGRGIDPTRISAAGITAGAPAALNGVVRETRMINGIAHAAISLGTDDAVKPGMEFNVLDRDAGRFLGKITIVYVDADESVGRITGDTAAVRAGNEVRTQL
jgi:peptidoglycan hydrolase CwlO-like protein